jgi:hypothetical protein
MHLSKDNLIKLFWIAVFAVSFGYLESAVVIYLRELYYPSGFNISADLGFPYIHFGLIPSLQYIPLKLLLIEVGREASTIFILVSLSMVASKNMLHRMGFFLLAFGLWDLSYYGFLKLITGWPESLSTLDILFLIPVPWIAPVWLPAMISVLFLFTSIFLIREKTKVSDF